MPDTRLCALCQSTFISSKFGQKNCPICVASGAAARAYYAAYQAKNPAKCRAAVRAWAAAHPDYAGKWAKENPGPVKAAQRRKQANYKFRALSVISGCSPPCCAACGELELAVLSVDHIAGDGAARRRAGETSSSGMYIRIAKGDLVPAGLRVLCMNCQFRSRMYKTPNPTEWPTARQLHEKGLYV
jgi:hypothetical protein